MALLAHQQIGITGLNATFSAASGGGDTVRPDDRVFLQVRNLSGGSINVTLVVPGARNGQALTDDVVAVGALTSKLIGPLTRDVFADPSDDLIDITYSATASVSVAALRI